ncbi:hypothetical protein GZ77_19115 [Endozoicomonas montiporae]|uniref:TIGR02449 family protein n=2 Tax=Endozoicomonas montiporae TaxID=1027273 RepID=A0A081N2E1_9GAMM|nr:TIGR02449 family protein [Endozoicomonas montiporae]AMO58422.1 cell division protein ZapB [Endozoicomonas montiporae CL-33]KEQ12614.1 hypothetical protein GZ77_19115 [Endozoicomonas montiporae]
MNDPNLTELSQKIEYLVSLCNKLKEENRLLRNEERKWQLERAYLMSTKDQARGEVEDMIKRLRGLEQ